MITDKLCFFCQTLSSQKRIEIRHSVKYTAYRITFSKNKGNGVSFRRFLSSFLQKFPNEQFYFSQAREYF